MRTLIRIDGASCAYCMNEVREALLARPLVHAVGSSAVAGHWEIDHDDDDLAAITNIVRQTLHGWEVADNGEIIMIGLTPGTDHCTLHGTDSDCHPPAAQDRG